MKKLVLIPILSFISIFLIFNNFNYSTSDGDFVQCYESSLCITDNNDKANSVIAILLYKAIDEAIQNYYGKPTQFALYDSKIIEINQMNNEFSYIVTIEVSTFTGPHNPPYGIETLTFIITPGNIQLTSYDHQPLTD